MFPRQPHVRSNYRTFRICGWGKLHTNIAGDVIVFEKSLRSQKVFRQHENEKRGYQIPRF